VRPLGVVDVQVEEPLEELEVSGCRGGVPVRREVERNHDPRVYTAEIG
jgi:hypothetical protein